MYEPDENINWKQIAIQEIKSRRACEQKLYAYNAEMHQAKQLLQRSTGYRSHLEQSNAQLEHQCAEHEAEVQRAYQLLKKAKGIISQQQIELDVISEQLQGKIDALENLNKQLTQELLLKTESLNDELHAHELTQHKLKLLQQHQALEEKVNALTSLDSVDLSFDDMGQIQPILTDDSLKEFFVYKPFIGRV